MSSVSMPTTTSSAALPAEGSQAGTADIATARKAGRKSPQQMATELKAKNKARKEESAKSDETTAKGLDTAASTVGSGGDTLNKALAGMAGKQDAATAMIDATGNLQGVEGVAPVDATAALPAAGTTNDLGALVAPTDGTASAGGAGGGIGAVIGLAVLATKGVSLAMKIKAANQRDTSGGAMAMTIGTEALGMVTTAATAKSDGKTQAEQAYATAYKKDVGAFNAQNEGIAALETEQAELVASGEDTAKVDAQLGRAIEKRDNTLAKAETRASRAEERETRRTARMAEEEASTPEDTRTSEAWDVIEEQTAGELGRQRQQTLTA